MNSNIIASLSVAVLVAVGVGAYFLTNESVEDEPLASSTSQVIEDNVVSVSPLSLSGLATLDQGVYEGWIVDGDTKTSFGRFNIDSEGNIDSDLNLGDVDVNEGDKIVVTIEPGEDSDPEPSATVILAGDVVNGTASLAFPVDLASFSGTYITGTPTNDPVGEENSGVWFAIPGSNPQASLNIPDAPEGWIYEGWVVHQGTPLTTGQFTSASQRDSFDDYSGTSRPGPNLPGEDYLRNLPAGFDAPLNLADGETTVVVSLEPFQNGSDPTGDGPAQVKPLSHLISSDIVDHVSTELDLDTSAPSGTFSL